MTYYDTSYPPSLWTSPPVPPVPSLASVSPSTGVTGDTVEVHALGTGFTANSVIRFGATAMTTTFISATDISATGTLPAPNTYSITVADPNGISNGRPFIVTATADETPESAEPSDEDFEPENVIPVEVDVKDENTS